MSRYLIVNADDYNTDPERNRGILDAIRNGIITSVTMLANLPLNQEELSALQASLGGSIGVHLNLTRGRPLTAGLETLANEEGTFFAKRQAWVRALMGRYDLMEVEAEFSAQIERLMRAGITPDHIDGNNHIHIFPGLARAVTRVARRFGIVKIRLPLEPFDSRRQFFKKRAIKKALILNLSRRAARVFEASGLRFAERFAGIQHPCVSDADCLRAFIRELPEGITELMCHPGYLSVRGNPFSSEERSRETAALTDPVILKDLQNSDIHLISFKDL
jgi:predicted glycoside hydrolase/deacetylase ChbG (UPF0249 family)